MSKTTRIGIGLLTAGFAMAAWSAGAQVPLNVTPNIDHSRPGPEWNDRRSDHQITSKIAYLENRIARHTEGNLLSVSEADALAGTLGEVRSQYRQFARNGLTRREVRILESRLNRVRLALGYERPDSDGRFW